MKPAMTAAGPKRKSVFRKILLLLAALILVLVVAQVVLGLALGSRLNATVARLEERMAKRAASGRQPTWPMLPDAGLGIAAPPAGFGIETGVPFSSAIWKSGSPSSSWPAALVPAGSSVAAG